MARRCASNAPHRLILDIRSAETLALTTKGGNDTLAIGSNVAPLIRLMVDGGNGTDAIAINSSNDAETFTAIADNNRVRFERTTPTPFMLDIGAAETLALTTNGGDDRVAIGVGVDKVMTITADGIPIAAGQAIVEGDTTNAGLSSAGISASFSPSSATLTIFGNTQGNTITVSRDSAGTILVNGGAVRVQGGMSTVANTSLIQLYGQAGNDVLSLDEASGPLPKANVFGNTENNTLTGGSGADLLFGQAGNDSLLGKRGNDLLFGGADNDVLTGGDDTVDGSGLVSSAMQLTAYGGDHDDVLIGGDNTDVLFGEDGDDTLLGGPGVDMLDGGAGNNIVLQD